MWSITRALNMVYDHPECIDMKLITNAEIIWDGITFPVHLLRIDKFEQQKTTISIIAFGYENKNVNVLEKNKNYK